MRSLDLTLALPLGLTLCALASCALMSACGSEDTLPPAAPAQAPFAHLTLPRLASPAADLLFDAGLSQSPGGALAHYRFTFGDGTALVDFGSPRARHTYANEGVFAVLLEVEDLTGRTDRVQGQITIRQSAPTCARDEDCSTPDVCRESLCASTVTRSLSGQSEP